MKHLYLAARTLLAVTCVAGLPACQKIKDALGEAKRKAAESDQSGASQTGPAGDSTAPASVAKPGAAEIRQLSEAEFADFIARTDRLVVVDFYADWCGPCKVLGPVLEKVVSEQGYRVALGKLNVDQARSVASQQGVRSIPDVRLYLGGRKVDQFVGTLPEADLRARISKQVAKLPEPAAEGPGTEASPAEKPVAPAQPIAPMEKDWLPPGVERRTKGEGK